MFSLLLPGYKVERELQLVLDLDHTPGDRHQLDAVIGLLQRELAETAHRIA